jgi:Holliday junction resolvase
LEYSGCECDDETIERLREKGFKVMRAPEDEQRKYLLANQGALSL